MTSLDIRGNNFDIDAFVFDYDYTLVEINAFWGPRTERWVKKTAGHFPAHAGLDCATFDLIGYSPSRSQVKPESPLNEVYMEILYILAAGALWRKSFSWTDAMQIVEEYAHDKIAGAFSAGELRSIGNLAKTEGLVSIGVHVTIVTHDDRRITKDKLAFHVIENLINLRICGEDNIPNKLASDAIWQISDQIGIYTHRILRVGDSLSNMEFGRNASVAGLIGVKFGPGENPNFTARADVVIDFIDHIMFVK